MVEPILDGADFGLVGRIIPRCERLFPTRTPTLPGRAEFDHPIANRDLDFRAETGLLAHTTSNNPAAPIPPPMHIVTTTNFSPRRLPSISA